jgi:hypothetical protein
MTRRGMLVVALAPVVPVVAALRLGWLRGAGVAADLLLPLGAGVMVFFGTSWLVDKILGGGDA